ncbi:MAG: cytochrome c [Rhodospirillales bacterium]|jgi:cytochrome c556|nr:cytochrome c [Rhodospirillales bacterium]MDP6774970.1 cytochrome c [Rhodospirillales bacterium]
MKSIVHSFLLAAIIAALGAGAAAADSANDIKYRKAHMKALSGHLGPIFMVLKGEAGDKSHIAAHASALANVAMMAGGLFPAGSGTGDTEALPVIWEKPGEFEEKIKALEDATAKLFGAARKGDMAKIGAAAGAVGKSCGGCHKLFRKKKN